MERMEYEKFIEIMDDDPFKPEYNGDLSGGNTFLGLEIIRKYIKDADIEGAEHDIVFTVDVDKLLDAGIVESDVIKLKRLNWFVEVNGYLACFV